MRHKAAYVQNLTSLISPSSATPQPTTKAVQLTSKVAQEPIQPLCHYPSPGLQPFSPGLVIPFPTQLILALVLLLLPERVHFWYVIPLLKFLPWLPAVLEKNIKLQHPSWSDISLAANLTPLLTAPVVQNFGSWKAVFLLFPQLFWYDFTSTSYTAVLIELTPTYPSWSSINAASLIKPPLNSMLALRMQYFPGTALFPLLDFKLYCEQELCLFIIVVHNYNHST